MPENRWTFKTFDAQKAEILQQELGVHPIICQLLVQRGIETYDAAHRFFRPSMEHLHDPFLMKNMEKAVDRLEEALKNEERILIYGDYDVDGTTSVALVYAFLKDFFPDRIDYYIPDRYREGYGISLAGIDFAAENNFSLVIALDCGVKAIEQMDYANEKDIDFIICDHHLPGTELPKAFALLDPKQAECNYPYKELSGCGLGFKLMQAFAERLNIPFELLEKQLDLVAVSIAADIVPITGENRVLAYFGLKRINKNPRPGLLAMIEQAVLKKDLNITNLVFVIAPRINAAGRMSSGKNAVRLLVAESPKEIDQLSFLLEEKNTERKTTDKQITQQALEMIRESPGLINKKTTVLWHETWHKGVIGIVASRLIENYHRPTIVFTESNGMATGSARSVKGFSIYEAIEACSDLLEQFGGHKYAAGLSVKKENLTAFSEKFEMVVSETIPEKCLSPEIEIDAELGLDLATDQKFYTLIEQFAPFGPGNMRPVFISRHLKDARYSKIVKEEHLKLDVMQNDTYRASGIAFQQSKHFKRISKGTRFSLVYSLDLNEWNGNSNIQLMVKDLKFEDDEAKS
ncbi:MAG: single-stranded-DNA-specific exonuclease RecJ [Chitinophagales bacterium]